MLYIVFYTPMGLELFIYVHASLQELARFPEESAR
jgi:hypothetical protein